MTDSDERTERLWNKRYEVLYRSELSSIYHKKRERYFSLLDRWEKVLTLLLGSAAFIKVVNLDHLPLIALPFALVGFASLVFDFSQCARHHAELAFRFKMLESEIEEAGEMDLDEKAVYRWSARFREIESGEPAAYNMLIRVCQNEMARAKGHIQDITYVPLWKSFLANFYTFPNSPVKQSGPSAT